MVKLAPSILAANFAHLEAHVREAIAAGADWLHIDVMDGRFVPSITIGPLIVKALHLLRAYPKDPAARKAIRAQAKCKKAR